MLTLAILLLVALIALWTERKPIVSTFIDRTLAADHVRARYKIADLGLNRQRLTDVVIGDPDHPDLVADWVELRTGLGLSGVEVLAIRAGHVRMKARLVNGKLSFGTIDKLLPAPSAKPFTLPRFVADIADARIRLTTPQGVVGLKLSGQGQLNDGFSGALAGISDRLDLGGCVTGRVSAALAIRVTGERPSLAGPVQLERLECAETTLAKSGADVSLVLNDALDRWQGSAKLAVASVDHPMAHLRDVRGSIDFAGTATDTSGQLDLKSGRFASNDANGAGLALKGAYRLASAGSSFKGSVGATGLAASPRLEARLASFGSTGAGTPLAPLLRQLAVASVAAVRSIEGEALVDAVVAAGRGHVSVTQFSLRAASGARVALDAGAVGYDWPDGAVHVDGRITTGGGGLPASVIRLTQAEPGTPVTGAAIVQPYAAGKARLVLSPVTFSATPGGITHIATRATLSGPLGDGRVDNLSLPLIALWDGHARVQVNRTCAPLAFDRLAVSGLALARAQVALCPVDGALVRFERGRLGGGARLGGVRLGGKLGSSPIGLTAQGVEVHLADTHFLLTGLGVRIGAPESVTKLDFAAVDGRLNRGTLGGHFSGGRGQIGKVPLLLSAADGDWTVLRGKLDMTGVLQVADSAPAPRFNPLAAQAVALTLADNVITATGTLLQPARKVAVANVTIVHDLGKGIGHADLAVPGITFNPQLQPDELTTLTYGVIANVAGTLTGDGHIAWTPQGVASNGAFRTAGMDLAAAFGPVTGIAGEVRFTDLLNLETAPGQVATVKTINPGIAVNDGTIRYQLLAGSRIQVEEGRWPFAGGSLLLEPSLLNFGEHMERHLTFRVAGMNAAQFLQQFDFKNLDATGVFDGVLPMIFDESGGRIEDGHLIVRPGGGTLAYVGEVSQKDVGFWGNFAFQALKSLRYRSLDIVMNGPLAGEMITEVRFAGVGQGKGAKRNFILDRLQKLPLVFNVRIKAPFRGLIDSAQSFYDPKRLIQRNLPALLLEQEKRAKQPAPPAPLPPTPIQPPESRKMP